MQFQSSKEALDFLANAGVNERIELESMLKKHAIELEVFRAQWGARRVQAAQLIDAALSERPQDPSAPPASEPNPVSPDDLDD